jgi:hypothetical protein
MTVPERSYRRRFHAPWVIFWVGFAVRVAWILVGRTYRLPALMDHFDYGWEVGRIARSLVEGRGYGNPFNGPSGATAWLSPLYPLLVALGFKLFGVYSKGAAIFVMVCDSAFSAGTAMAVYEIAARCFDARGIASRGSVGAPVAMWSAWLWALYPGAMQYAVRWIWEMSLSTFLFTWALVVALRLRGMGEDQGPGLKPLSGEADEMRGLKPSPNPEGQGRKLWSSTLNPGPWALNPRSWALNALLFGALWGLVGLSNPSLLICLPAVMVWVAWPELRRWELSGRVVVGAALTCVAFGLVMAPWVVRNERVLHAFVPTRSNLGVELYDSTLERNDVFPWGSAMPMWAGDPEFREFVRMGEVPFARMRQREAVVRIRARPGKFVRNAVDRFFFYWDDTPHFTDRLVGEYLRRAQYAFLSLCGLMGLGLMLRRRVEGAGLLALCFLLVPIPYYLVTVQARFRHPLEPLIVILGVYLFRSVEPRARREAMHG